jgi:hypothetical protein
VVILADRNIDALLLASVVKESHSGGRHAPQVDKGIFSVLFDSLSSLFASVVNRPGGQRSHEVGSVRVVTHDHGS